MTAMNWPRARRKQPSDSIGRPKRRGTRAMTVDEVLRDLDRLVIREDDLQAREARRRAERRARPDARKERFAAAARIEAENRAHLIAAADEQERRRQAARAIAALHNGHAG